MLELERERERERRKHTPQQFMENTRMASGEFSSAIVMYLRVVI